VDSSGYLIKHPYINNALNRLAGEVGIQALHRWWFQIPGFALADDGFLSLYQGRSSAHRNCCHRTERSVRSVPERVGVRYHPHVKTCPYTRVSTAEAIRPRNAKSSKNKRLLNGQRSGRDLVEKQIRLDGAFTLHSELQPRWRRFRLRPRSCGGRRSFPSFCGVRFAHQDRHEKAKSKRTKKQSPWGNLARFANQAKGNQIGSITTEDLLLRRRFSREKAYQLGMNCKHALDSLKWAPR